ncbi:MAG: COG4315 family predicted lipoprotein, partial [Candidatus Limnocylindria bacterium]
MYVFANDTDGASTCNEECAASWPPVPGDSPIGDSVEASMFATITRSDGGEQLTVNGQPLYLYAADENPGDANGQDVNGVWFVVGADGVKVGGSAPVSQP